MSRKAISKKVRFEVFKRDAFTCQYCGTKAPDVILHVDHITPVSKGGDNSIFNLITACFDCNSGKKDRKLEINVELEKQRAELERLNERRNQIEAMSQWRDELSNVLEKEIDVVEQCLCIPEGNHLTDSARLMVGKWVHKYGFDVVRLAAETTIEWNFKHPHSLLKWNNAFNRIGSILRIVSKPGWTPTKQRVRYVSAIFANNMDDCDNLRAAKADIGGFLNWFMDRVNPDYHSTLVDLWEEIARSGVQWGEIRAAMQDAVDDGDYQ